MGSVGVRQTDSGAGDEPGDAVGLSLFYAGSWVGLGELEGRGWVGRSRGGLDLCLREL